MLDGVRVLRLRDDVYDKIVASYEPCWRFYSPRLGCENTRAQPLFNMDPTVMVPERAGYEAPWATDEEIAIMDLSHETVVRIQIPIKRAGNA